MLEGRVGVRVDDARQLRALVGDLDACPRDAALIWNLATHGRPAIARSLSSDQRTPRSQAQAELASALHLASAMRPSPPHPLFAFEQDDGLTHIPLAARRALDAAGERLSLEAWRSLPPIDRQALAEAGAGAEVDTAAVRALVARATPSPTPQPPRSEPSPASPPASLLDALGPDRPLTAARWTALDALARYALDKLSAHQRRERLVLAYHEIIASTRDAVRSPRRAVASSRVTMSPSALAQLCADGVLPGELIGEVRVAGIMAAKKTPELIPRRHAVALTHVEVDIEPTEVEGELKLVARVEALAPAGVELEAMTAASVAALTLYDRAQSIDRWATVGETQLEGNGDDFGEAVRPARPLSLRAGG